MNKKSKRKLRSKRKFGARRVALMQPISQRRSLKKSPKRSFEMDTCIRKCEKDQDKKSEKDKKRIEAFDRFEQKWKDIEKKTNRKKMYTSSKGTYYIKRTKDRKTGKTKSKRIYTKNQFSFSFGKTPTEICVEALEQYYNNQYPKEYPKESKESIQKLKQKAIKKCYEKQQLTPCQKAFKEFREATTKEKKKEKREKFMNLCMDQERKSGTLVTVPATRQTQQAISKKELQWNKPSPPPKKDLKGGYNAKEHMKKQKQKELAKLEYKYLILKDEIDNLV